MNKSELTVKLAKKVGLTHAKAAEVVDAIFDARKGIVAVELDAGRKVTIPGFGAFATRRRSATQGRNPATGKTITIPARKYATFRAGRMLVEVTSGGTGRMIYEPPPGAELLVRAGTRMVCPVPSCSYETRLRRKGLRLLCPIHKAQLVPASER
jgi:DNA-binding protein HU-beta